jgi:hypothetical protein
MTIPFHGKSETSTEDDISPFPAATILGIVYKFKSSNVLNALRVNDYLLWTLIWLGMSI